MGKHIDAGWNFYSKKITKCNRCGQTIIWRESKQGKQIAYDPTYISPDGKDAKAHGGNFHKCYIINHQYEQTIYLTDFNNNDYQEKKIVRTKETACQLVKGQKIEIKGITYICFETELEKEFSPKMENGYKTYNHKQVITLYTENAIQEENKRIEEFNQRRELAKKQK